MCAAELARRVGDSAAEGRYRQVAGELKGAIVKHLWDSERGAFFDNRARPRELYPQDGNALAVWFNLTTSAQSAQVSDYLHSNWGEFGASSPEWNGDIGTFPGSMEVHAHMAAGRADRSHALMRLQWGYQLLNPESTQSTFWEGYRRNGSFAFRGIYMSNAHGWATGPATALTFHTLGLRPLAPSGAQFAFAPSFGGLAFCQGRLHFGAGFVDAAWNVSVVQVQGGVGGAPVHVMRARLALDSSHHEHSRGLISLAVTELAGPPSKVVVDGETVWRRGRHRAPCASAGGCAASAARLTVGVDQIELQGVEPGALVLEVESES